MLRLALGSMLLVACSAKGAPASKKTTTRPEDAATRSAASVTLPLADAGAAGSGADASAPPRGRLTLVIQKVSSHCMVEPWETYTSFLGHDLILEAEDGSGSKPTKQFVFCPQLLADGGAAAPKLNTWEMCSRFAKCTVASRSRAERGRRRAARR